ncbi:hypothetical protein N7478_010741 [Penicillium angulare]|uniref:uncharacterized protein n=1 Tax=Penicillium angulare TaxID=116970 RepID=UPI00253FAE89|nr:uncharacterized protein N7478_010741 [Penicillium angulare]KAJ5267933.1 hypothetical protein N7478_010741 [Penicillium angulare]
MYEQPYTTNKIARTATALASGFAKLGEQLAECGEFHPPAPFFEFIPKVARRLKSRDVNTDMGGQVPEDSMVGLGFAAMVALKRLDLHFEARFDGTLLHRPAAVGLHQGMDVRRNSRDAVRSRLSGSRTRSLIHLAAEESDEFRDDAPNPAIFKV